MNANVSLLQSDGGSHVALLAVRKLEDELLSRPRWMAQPVFQSGLGKRVASKVVHALNRTKAVQIGGPRRNLFSILMGPHRMAPYSISLMRSRGNKAAYIFDTWPHSHDYLVHAVKEYRINRIFLTARDSVEALEKRLPDGVCVWLPEALPDRSYRHLPAEQRDIDILQLGRRYDRYHELVCERCKEDGLTYLYEKKKGEIIFTTSESFLDGLSRSKISICFPRSVTHPEIARGISTVTLRYLESMVSKCLVVGTAPDELREMFPYSPMIEIDWGDPYGQLRYILDHYDSYSDLIERNFDYVMKHHMFANRTSVIERYFDSA